MQIPNRVRQFTGRFRKKKYRVLLTRRTSPRLAWPRPVPFFFAFALVVLVALAYFDSREHIFTIDADTERVTILFVDPNPFAWQVGSGRIMKDPWEDEMASKRLPEFSSLTIASNTEVVFQRHGIRDLTLILRNPGGSGGVLSVDNGSENQRLGEWTLLKLSPATRPMVLPFRGQLTVGEDVAQDVDSLLLKGTISILEAQLVRATRYSAGIFSLDRGDRVSFWHRRSGQDDLAAAVQGFVRVEPSDQEAFTEAVNAMQVIAHANANYARIERFGSLGYEIRAPKWARFLYDPLLAAIAALGAVVFAAIEIYSRACEMSDDPGHRWRR